MRKAFISAARWICRSMDFTSVGIVMILAFPVTYNAILREFRHPTIWAFEVVGYALIWGGFLGNPLTLKSGAHFRVALLQHWGARIWRGLSVFSLIVTSCFALFLTGTGIYAVWYSWSNHILSGTIINDPLWIPQLALPLGGIGLF
ncbi:MAG: TRAP transporter small permease, partial [Ktedonobacteraceae bacterium]